MMSHSRGIIIFCISIIFYSPALFAETGDGGTIAACYPGGFDQILSGTKPFVPQCAQFTKLGLCFHKGRPYAALVMFWLPTYALEVAGHAYTTVFPKSFADTISPMLLMDHARPGSMVQEEADTNSVQTKYRETHIYELSTADVAKILFGHPAMTCMLKAASSIRGGIVFKSEAYPEWRLGKDPAGIMDSLIPSDASIGSWGALYPRAGWSQHPSSITNSLLLSYRAQHLGSDLLALRRAVPDVEKYEIGGPVPGACNLIGAPTMLQEKGANRPGCADRVVTIYWRLVVTCCNFGTW